MFTLEISHGLGTVSHGALVIHTSLIETREVCSPWEYAKVSGIPCIPCCSCGATVLKLSSCRQGWSTYVDSIEKQQDAAL